MKNRTDGLSGYHPRLRNAILPILLISVMIVFSFFFIISRCAVIDGQTWFTMGDDAYISMRYAKHLAQGHGLVWNIGQPPIEGFTNLLWVLWIAFLMLLAQEPGLLMGISSAAFNIGSVFLLWRFLRFRTGAKPVFAVISAFYLAIWPPLHDQTASGLEGPMLLFLFLLSLYLITADETRSHMLASGGWLAGFLPLVRPNGLLFTGILLLIFFFQHIWPHRLNPDFSLKKYLWPIAGFFIPFLALTAFRFMYFGDIAPNTYYLKVSQRPGHLRFGMGYVKRFLFSFPAAPFILPMFFWGLKKNTMFLKLILLGMIGNLASVAWQGGDAWDNWRFMLLMQPLFLIALATIHQREKHRGGWTDGVLTAVFVCMCLLGAGRDFTLFAQTIRHGALTVQNPPPADSAPVKNIQLGLLLRETCAKDAVIADFWAGAAPYCSELTAIDMLGKSDRHIARTAARVTGGLPGHDKFDFDYVLAQKPDVILSRYKLWASETAQGQHHMGKVLNTSDPAGAALLLHPEFKKNYRPLISKLGKNWRAIYIRKESCKFNQEKAEAIENRLLALKEQKNEQNY